MRTKRYILLFKIMSANKDKSGVSDSVQVENVLQVIESCPENKVSYEVLQPGELSLDEDTAGGMGRHLGVTSTTLLT